MPRLSFHRLAQNRFILLTSILATGGWLVAFGGAVVLKALYGAWWVVIYEALIVAGTLMVFMSNRMQHYRYSFLTFLGASIPLLTIQVDYVIQYTKPTVPREPANAYAAGYIVLIIVQYMWVVVFGSDPSSYFGQFGALEQPPSLSTKDAGHHQPETIVYGEKHLEDISVSSTSQITGIMGHQLPPPQPQENLATPLPPAHSSVPTYTPPAEPVVQYHEQVEALHAYTANPDDPNELSFEKGEMLQVVDRKGNWWQARKATGEIGIIPSNYFGPATGVSGNAGPACQQP
ncbi:hypothetical protein K492DRAFT_156788 [Lichtheimia hyalospora FSU 10163]|nr:hypothetical protein K492DRAFT_156788 [Lichtheimia hyalospora FSU 10163]